MAGGPVRPGARLVTFPGNILNSGHSTNTHPKEEPEP
ncbi:MAG: hypothetical protein JWM85_1529 [Acidimicrobiaceae bacterium]|nr:hypothetical protein [Acidimicrobiaceae bacterium]